MSTYLMFAKNAFRQNVIYRANTAIQILRSGLYLLISFNIWQALYATNSIIENVSLDDMLTYAVLTELLHAFSNSNIGYNIGNRLLTGEIAGDFVRPINIKLYLIATHTGESFYTMLFNCIPISLMTVIFGTMLPPTNVLNGVLFFVSLILGIILMYQLDYTLGLFVFWLKNHAFITQSMSALRMLFAGTTIPLWFYPDVLRNIALCLPFRYMTFEPISIYLGKTNGIGIAFTICMQLVWIVVIYYLGHSLWSKAEKRVFINGG